MRWWRPGLQCGGGSSECFPDSTSVFQRNRQHDREWRNSCWWNAPATSWTFLWNHRLGYSPLVDITPKTAAAALVARAQAEEEALIRRADLLRAAVRNAVPMLRQTFGATHVFLFGSLAWGGFRGDSDIDLAVEGLDAAKCIDITRELERSLGAPVEIFRLESLPVDFRQRIVTEGLELA